MSDVDVQRDKPRVRLVGVLTALCLALVALAGCSDPYDPSGPSDELAAGQLCLPGTADCPDHVLLRRTAAIGADRVDFRLTNLGSDQARITVRATLPAGVSLDAGTDTDASAPDVAPPDVGTSDAGDAGSAGDAPSVVASRSYTLAAGESVADRFVQDELFTHTSFTLAIQCDACQATLDYSLGSEPLECRSDDDCSGVWVCSQADGRCVECLHNSDCADNQTCDMTTRSCTPPTASGCSQTPISPLSWLAGVLGLVALVVLGRRRLLAAVFAASLVLVIDLAPAHAAPPRAGVNLGVGWRFLSGELGANTKRGIGITIDQELRSDHFGGRVELGASYFLTTQQAPPLSHELMMYSVALGPLAYFAVGPTEVAVGLDYRHVGLVSNSLVRLTGPDVNHGAAGATVEVRYRLAPIDLMVRGGYHPIFGLNSSLFTVDLAVGLTAQGD